MAGWIKLHRSTLEWEWFKDHKTSHVFNYCLMKANFKEGKFQGKTIPAGSFVTGRKVMAVETGLSEQEIRTAIFKLKSTSNLTIKSTSKYSIISIVNWSLYQDDQPTTAHESNQRATTIEEGKKEKNKEYNFAQDVLQAWMQAYPKVDIQAEIKKAMAWEASNPRKAKKDKRRFMNNWLANAKPSPAKPKDTSDKMELQKQLMGISDV